MSQQPGKYGLGLITFTNFKQPRYRLNNILFKDTKNDKSDQPK